jgi:transcription elongation GreA/GreB family factor
MRCYTPWVKASDEDQYGPNTRKSQTLRRAQSAARKGKTPGGKKVMSRAFIRESEIDTNDLPDRALSTRPNFVTPEGLAAIERALNRFNAALRAAVDKGDKAATASSQRELRYWAARRASAHVIELLEDNSRVHFGATVTVRRDDGRMQAFRIVGEDEAQPIRGTLSHASPLARAILGKSVGEIVTVLGHEVEILEIQ